jgi:hypothetical protein
MSKREPDSPKTKYLLRKLRERRYAARTEFTLDEKTEEDNREVIKLLLYLLAVGAILLLVSGGNGVVTGLEQW